MKPVVCLFALLFAASAAEEFEVASVKIAQPGPQGVWNNGSPDRFRMLNMTLHALVATAYGVQDYQVSGPAWMTNERYDIIAKVSPEVAKLPWDDKWKRTCAMTQVLLADRFKLELHRESKELPAYALIPTKGGTKLKEIGPDPGELVRNQRSAGHLKAEQMPMRQLIEILHGLVKRPILDETGIKGVFDITLDWAPETNQPPETTDPRPSLFTALQEQLGLKLEARKATVPVLVIDRVEKLAEQ
jgi:uncharacterized protein (TIGR03435 family)